MGGKSGELSGKQRLFIAEYLKDKNATKAAIRAGYSKNTAQQIGSRLLSNVVIKAEISKRLGKIEEECLISVKEIVEELKRVGMLDVTRAFDGKGKLLPIAEIPEDTRRAMAGFEVEDIVVLSEKIGTTKKVRFHDKVRALELLGKYKKMFTDIVQHEGLEGLADRMRNAEERLGRVRKTKR